MFTSDLCNFPAGPGWADLYVTDHFGSVNLKRIFFSKHWQKYIWVDGDFELRSIQSIIIMSSTISTVQHVDQYNELSIDI